MRKTVISITLIVAIITTVYITSSVEVQAFSDVGEDYWGYKYIQEMHKSGRVSGYPDGTFKPNNNITRAEYTKILGKVGKLRSKDFSDVPKDHWAYEYIMYSNAEGYGNNIFGPNDFITREQAIVLLYKAMGSPKLDSSDNFFAKFSDFSKCSNWAVDALKWAVSQKIIQGDGKSIRPNDLIVRGEATTIIYRFEIVKAEIEKQQQKTTPVPEVTPPPTTSTPVIGGGGSGGGGGITTDTPLLKLYTRENNNVVELSNANFLNKMDNVSPGWKKTETLIIKNVGKAKAEYSLYIVGDILSNDNFRNDISIKVEKVGNNQVILDEKTIDSIGSNPLINNRTLEVNQSEEFIITISLVKKDTLQNYMQGKTTSFDFVCKY